MKRKLHKITASLSAVMLAAGISVTSLSADSGKTGWQGSLTQKEINEGTLDESQTEIGLNGYIGNVSPDAPGIDIDEDGKVDYIVEQDKMIEASVPAEVGIVATGNGSGSDFKVNFICPTIAVINENEKKPIQVKLTNGEVTGGDLMLKAFDAVSSYGSSDFGLKVVPAARGAFSEQDVTTLKTAPLTVASKLTGAIGYKLDAQYTAAMLDTHAGTGEAKPEVTLHYSLELVL